MPGLVPICFTCARLRGLTPRGWSCEAFPAIPVDILSSTADHRRPFEGDGGLRYEERAAPEVPAESRHDAADIFRRDAVEEEPPVRAAGVMHVADDGRVLLMRRTDSGLWAFPGGHVEEGETPEAAAAREVREETGYQVDAEDLVPWTRRVADGVNFTTFIHRCGETFEPVLNHEHDEYAWEPWGDYSGEALARVAGRGGDEASGGYSATGDALPPSHAAALARGARSDAWEESKHPRGQPGNAGQFGPGGGGAKKEPSEKKEAEPEKEPVAKKKPAPKPEKLATKSQAATIGWHMKNYGFEPAKGGEAVYVNKKTGETAYVLPPDPGKGTSAGWQVGEKVGSGATSLNQYMNHVLGHQPESSKYLPKSLSIKASSSPKEVGEALAQLGVSEKASPVAKASAISDSPDPQHAAQVALEGAGWKFEKGTNTTEDGYSSFWTKGGKTVEVFADGSWWSEGIGTGVGAADLVKKGVVSMVEQPDAAFEAQHPRGPGGQFIAKLKADFPWLGDAEQGDYTEGVKISSPNNGTFYLNPDSKSWQLVYPHGKAFEGKTTDNSLGTLLGQMDHIWKNDPASMAVPSKKSVEFKPAVGAPIKLSDLKKVGPKMGSNEGGTYEAADGTRYYVKLPQSDDHAKNELLAASLYRLAGGSVLDYHPVEGEKLGVGTKLVSLDVSNVSALSPEQRKEAQRDFAIHAWLANWDAVGIDGANVGVVAGKPVNLDLGGSLLYRAQGSPKGDKFDVKASEWKTLRQASINPKAAQLFAGMTSQELLDSANRLKAFKPEDITKLVKAYGPGDDAAKTSLIHKLIKRREAILVQAHETHKAATTGPQKPAAPPKPEKYGLHGDTPSEADAVRKQVAESMPPRSHKVNSAMTSYKGNGYEYMNDCLRYADCDDERVVQLQKYLDKAKLPAMTVYRGIRNQANIAQKIWSVLKVGRTFRPDGFDSCSTLEDFSKGWISGYEGSIMMEIRVPDGSRGVAVRRADESDSEYEILLQHGSGYVVEEMDPVKRRMVVMLTQHHMAEQQQKKEAA